MSPGISAAGGRESALAARMAEHSELHAFVGHENPTILANAASSGGTYALGDVCDPAAVAAFARCKEIDVAMVGADEPLAVHQRVYGHRSLPPAAQRELRDRFLAVFDELQSTPVRPAVSTP